MVVVVLAMGIGVAVVGSIADMAAGMAVSAGGPNHHVAGTAQNPLPADQSCSPFGCMVKATFGMG